MAGKRNRRRSTSSRSKSASPSPNLVRRDDDLEAQKGAVGSLNSGSKQKAGSIVSSRSSARRTHNDVLPSTSVAGALNLENQVLGDPKDKSRADVARTVGGKDPAQATNPVNIPLPPSVENLSQHGRIDGESASSGIGPHSPVQDNEEKDSINASNLNLATEEDRGSDHNERAASPTRPHSPGGPTGVQKTEDKSTPAGETSDPWTRCADAVWDYEKNRVEKWKEDINNLLLFSGLFSTALTGFIVQYYVMLSKQVPDASETALMVISSQLAAISAQLNAFANGAAHLNVTQPAIPSPATSPPIRPVSRTTISTCTLWFMALVCSLGSALIGIVVSQWLQHHGDKTTSTSRQSIRIWYFRDRGFVEWRVQDIINTLPLLLQISVMLFLAGLIELLFTMNVIVASIVTILVVALLTFTIGTALIPAFMPKCPYKSPQAWWFFLSLRWLTKHLEHVFVFKHLREAPSGSSWWSYLEGGVFAQEYLLRRLWHSVSLRLNGQSFRANMPTFSSWRDLEYFLVRSQAEETEDKLKMMVHADEILTDETSLPDIISPCVTESDLYAALPACYAIMQRRAHETRPSDHPNQPELIWHQVDSDGQLVIALGDMAVNMFTRVTNANVYYGDRKAEQLHILKILDKLLRVLPWTQPGAAVYLRLCALADAARLSDEVRKKLAELMVAYYYLSRDKNKDIRPMLSAISSCQDLDLERFSWGVAGILEYSALLPRAEFKEIHNELRGALAAVAEYFGRPDAAALADHLTQHVVGWHHFRRLSNACVELAKVDKMLFSPEIVNSLWRFSSLCSDGYWKEEAQNDLKTLREVTGLPPHPDVVPAAESQPSSAADS